MLNLEREHPADKDPDQDAAFRILRSMSDRNRSPAGVRECVIGCVNWGDQSLDSERFLCPCGTAIALSKANIPTATKMGFQPICLACVAGRLEAGDPVGGGLVAGEFYNSLERAILAVQALRDRN